MCALLLRVNSNTCWYVGLSSVPPTVAFVLTLMSLCVYLPSKQDMKIREYRKGAISLKRAALVATVAILPLLITTAVFFVSEPEYATLKELIRAGLLLASGVSIFLIHVMESRVHYTEILPISSSLQEDSDV